MTDRLYLYVFGIFLTPRRIPTCQGFDDSGMLRVATQEPRATGHEGYPGTVNLQVILKKYRGWSEPEPSRCLVLPRNSSRNPAGAETQMETPVPQSLCSIVWVVRMLCVPVRSTAQG